MTWSVDFWESTATSPHATARLTGGELEVLTALAFAPGSGSRIATMLRPDAEPRRYRIRGRLLPAADGFSFDLTRASRRFLEWHATDGVRPFDAETTKLIELARRVRLIEHDSWEWFAPHRARLKEAARSFVLCAARSAGARGDFDRSIALLDELLIEDGGDDEAREITIRANLGAGRRSAALRAYRVYVAELRNELGIFDAPAFAEFAD